MSEILAKLKSRLIPTSFRYKLMLSHIGISLAIILLFSGISVIYTFNAVRDNEEKTLNQLVAIINQDLNSRLKAYNNSCFDLVINEIVKQNLNKSPSEQRQAKQNIGTVLRPVRLGDSSISNIMILDFKGNVYSTDITLMLPTGFNLKNTSVYNQAATGNGTLMWLTENDIFESYSPSDIMYQSRTNIHAAAIIKDYTTNRELGVLILSLRKNFFKNITYSGEVLQRTGFYLVSSDKAMVYPVSSTVPEFSKDLLGELDFSKNHSFAVIQSCAVDYQYNDAIKWFLVSVTDDKTLYGITYQLFWVLLLCIVACVVLSLVFSRALSGVLYGGIAEMKKGMAEVEKGNLNVVIHTRRTDEFVHLIESFNRMVKQIRELIVEKYQQELARREAEFHALQMQINPHFLYNTFDMLHWKLIEHDQEQLSESVVSISKVLRYSISNSTNNVTLEQELENVSDYLQVLSSISDKKIECTVHTADEKKIMLPRLIIQPLVENSVLHGFESRIRENRLIISGYYAQSNVYCIEISDNGLGIQPQLLQELNNDAQKSERASNHLGVKNVRRRIQYLYGDSASVSVCSEYGKGTCVQLRLPLQRGTNPVEDSGN